MTTVGVEGAHPARRMGTSTTSVCAMAPTPLSSRDAVPFRRGDPVTTVGVEGACSACRRELAPLHATAQTPLSTRGCFYGCLRRGTSVCRPVQWRGTMSRQEPCALNASPVAVPCPSKFVGGYRSLNGQRRALLRIHFLYLFFTRELDLAIQCCMPWLCAVAVCCDCAHYPMMYTVHGADLQGCSASLPAVCCG